MKHAPWWALLALLAIGACAPSQAHAEDPATPAAAHGRPSLADTLSGQAKSDYEAGRVLFADGDYLGAFVKFEQAHALQGDARLLWNMAACEKNRRHYSSVLALLERYKREGGATFTDAHRQEVDDVVAMVRLLISTVELVVDQAGASVYVDDHPVGTTPLKQPLHVDLGKRRLRIAKPGFVEQSIVQDFTGGSSLTLRFALQPQPRDGRLRIAAQGTIYVDGKRVGQGAWDGMLPAGVHTLRISAVDMRPYERDVVLIAGQTRSLNITLSPVRGGGVSPVVWIGAAVLAASGLAVGGYFLLRDESQQNLATGTLGSVRL